MDLRDLKFFIAVYETKGFSTASKLLGTVQSNVSAKVRTLEENLGGEPLFERRWRRVVPTARGRKFYAYAKEMLARLDYGERAFKPSKAAQTRDPSQWTSGI